MATPEPGGGVVGDRTFEYALNAMEAAGQHEQPATQGYAEKRRRVFEIVADLRRELAEAEHARVNVMKLNDGWREQIDELQQALAEALARVAVVQQANEEAAAQHRDDERNLLALETRAQAAERALKFYSDRRNYHAVAGDPADSLPPVVTGDHGWRAREALGITEVGPWSCCQKPPSS